jgi:hypothetical protein
MKVVFSAKLQKKKAHSPTLGPLTFRRSVADKNNLHYPTLYFPRAKLKTQKKCFQAEKIKMAAEFKMAVQTFFFILKFQK